MPPGNLVNEADARLRQWLASAKLKPGTRLPSERSLAVQLKLQHYALNRAMARLIAEGTVERTGYKLFFSSGAPVATRFTCHLVVARRSIHIPSYKRVAKETGVKLVIHTWHSTEEALLLLGQLDTPDTEAVVFDPPYATPVSTWESLTRRLIRHGIPVVTLSISAAHCYSVTTDNQHDLQLAIEHLCELGHRELGFITPPPTNPMSTEILQTWESLCQRHQLGNSAGRIHLQAQIHIRKEADMVAELLAGDWSTATALVMYSALEYNAQLLQEQLARLGRPVPHALSLIYVGGGKSPTNATSPVTTVGVEVPLMQEIAFGLAQRAVRKKKAMGILPPACCLRVQSQLIPRSSTRSLTTGQDQTKEPGIHHEETLSTQTPQRLRSAREVAGEFESARRQAYPLAARGALSEQDLFVPVDLGQLVNRPLNFRRGWLGDHPLKQLPPGRQEFHGVPFTILGGPRRSDCGAIVFQSAVNTTGNAQKLPDRLVIPIKSKARAIYVLHGCGFAKFLHAFATYSFKTRRTCLGKVPLVALGTPPPGHDPAHPAADAPVPNIQDWWPDFPRTSFPHARMAPISESEDGGRLQRHVYLYTLEWINPTPDKIVDCLEIEVDASLPTTLGVLAITVLKP